MAKRPVIALIGRPNVGKSTLFNRLIRKRLAIVNDTPGVTRDRIFHEIELEPGIPVLLTDTGGLEPTTSDHILAQMRTQTLTALADADLIIMIVDAKEGVTAMDEEVADVIRRAAKPVILAANKVDVKGAVHNISDFYGLGFEPMIPISSAHGDGMDRLRETAVEILGLEPSFADDEEPAEDRPRDYRISIIGKPNVGKSSLLNRMLGEDRVLVSDMPGTTRDAIDTTLRYHGTTYRVVDTAGIRRKSKVHDVVEKVSVLQAQKNIERSDVVLMLVDSSEDPSLQDANISGYAHNHYKNVIILFNKWDLVEKDTGTVKKFEQQLRQRMKFLKHAPILFISAKTGQRVSRIFPLIEEQIRLSTTRLQTAKLNNFLEAATRKHRPPLQSGRTFKFYYMTQTGTLPLSFALFTNSSKAPHFSYQRYLENELRTTFGLEQVPLKLTYRARTRHERKRDKKR